MKKLILLLIALFYFSINLFSQNTVIFPSHEYFEENEGRGWRIRILNDTSYIIFGTLNNSGSLGGSVVSKFSKNDSLLWQNIYDKFGANLAFNDVVYQDGTVYSIINNVLDQSDPPIILAAYWEDGSIRFEKPILDSLGELQYLHQIKSKGNRLYCIATNRSNAPSPPQDIFTFVKLKPSGKIEKKYDYFIPNSHFGAYTNIFLFEDSIICRTSYSLNGVLDSLYYASLVFDYDANLLDSSFENIPSHLNQYLNYDNFGNAYYFTLGSSQQTEIIKLTPTMKREKLYTLTPKQGYNLFGLHLIVGNKGVDYLAWTEFNPSDTSSIAFISHLDSLGNLLWETQVPVSSTVVPTYPLMMEKGILFEGGLVGYLDLFDQNNNTEPYLFQITPDGKKFFSWKVDLTSDKSITNDIAIDQNNNVILTGERQAPHPEPEGMFIAKVNPPLYVQTLNAANKPLHIPKATLIVSPNPFVAEATLTVKRKSNKEEKVQLSIVDTQGKTIHFQSNLLSQMEEKIHLRPMKIESGLYWVVVQGKNWSIAEKVTVK